MDHRINKIVATMALLLAGYCTANAEVWVKLREQAVASGTIVRLGDVADVVAADRDLARRLADVRLMPAPAPGTQRFVERREIEDLIVAQGVDGRELRFDGAAKTAIATENYAAPSNIASDAATTAAPMNRHAAVLAGRATESAPAVSAARAEELRTEVSRAIAAYLNEKGGHVGEWQATCEAEERSLALLDAATSPLVCQGSVVPAVGRQRFTLSFNTGKGAMKVPVYAEVSVAAVPMVVSIRPIARGAVITAADVELRAVESLPNVTNRRQALRDIELIVGMEASQAIQADQVVFDDQVKSPRLVKRGEVISLVSQAGGIRVRTTARAKQDGARGDLIQLETIDKRDQIDARVTGPHEATVFALTRETRAKSSAWIETARRPATR